MTKPGYTHVLIPKTLHSVLKENAECEKTSVWKYIQGLIQSKNSIEQQQFPFYLPPHFLNLTY